MATMTLATRYQQNLHTQGWAADAAQLRAVTKLDQLIHDLHRPGSWWQRFRAIPEATCKGLYMWGGVGRGKTYLMDLFFEELGETRKMRQHFHRFMQDVHEQLKEFHDTEDPLHHVAQKIRTRARVICFDEFFVSDIADAMILGRLFEKLFKLGAVLVATSNVKPDNLYKNGLQRSRFLPAIAALKKHTQVMHIDGDEDYRLRVLKKVHIYHWPHDDAATRLLDEYFAKIAPDAGTRQAMMRVEGRQIRTVRRADGVVWFSFEDICDGPRGASDYIEIARTFQAVLVSNVPQLNSQMENQARRFITMVDEFYDRRVKLILSAATPLKLLYQGSKLTFEFKRTNSRLIEMQSADYLSKGHIP